MDYKLICFLFEKKKNNPIFQHETILFRQPNSIFEGSNVITKKYRNEKKKENSLRFNWYASQTKQKYNWDKGFMKS